jgi:IBR domain, a half RING-finger domain
LLTPDELEKFYEFSFNQAAAKEKDISWCPTANCNYAFVYDPSRDAKEFSCIKCKKEYCLQCRSD